MIARHTERLAAQPVITAQRFDTSSRRLDQGFDNGGRNVVAVERRFERARVAARSRVEPVALANAVVERRVGIHRGLVGAVECAERLLAVRLLVPRREDRAVLPV